VIDRINGVDPGDSQFRFDISFGAPPVYRRPVLEHALAVLGPDLLQFGSDRFLPCGGAHIKSAVREVEGLLDALGVADHDRARNMGRTAATWLGLIPVGPADRP